MTENTVGRASDVLIKLAQDLLDLSAFVKDIEDSKTMVDAIRSTGKARAFAEKRGMHIPQLLGHTFDMALQCCERRLSSACSEA